MTGMKRGRKFNSSGLKAEGVALREGWGDEARQEGAGCRNGDGMLLSRKGLSGRGVADELSCVVPSLYVCFIEQLGRRLRYVRVCACVCFQER